ncbi:RCC1 domain-containing protein [Amycolatopsis suaedae]|uniref:RCC1 repeat-containing protein n=1 Tax=Amycolatopsis suaedae TaxID=2510978 RepID=A0A4Q7J7F6_9PSEU|nr:RCC1 domain-containing protein [Amycolatopsis suaedae]RZQ62283.1 RCC1 repeat-containing protein [Amycolatopsis suaedae]
MSQANWTSRARWLGTALATVIVALGLTAPPAAAAGPPELTGATGIAGGRGHTCAVVGDGRVQCWGGNASGELGNGSTDRELSPVEVTGLAKVSAVTVGGDHTCALTLARTVYCWGANASGQLGDGTTTQRPAPVPVRGLVDVAAVAAGRNHTCAVKRDGTAHCWGANDRGQLGDATTTGRPLPAPVSGLTGVTDIEAADAFHTCALTADGSVYCWGWNQLGQLGDGKQNDPPDPNRANPTPTRVVGIAGATAVAVTGAANACALLAGGSVRCWGWNTFGQLGVGGTPSGSITDGTHSATPLTVLGLPPVTRISEASGTGQACAVTADDRLYCWGHNGLGQIGDGGNQHRSLPVQVLTGVRAVTGGADHTCALMAGTHSLRCWGHNNEGQLGDGTTANRPTPFPVLLASAVNRPTPAVVAGTGGAVAVGAGSGHTCAIVAGGAVKCWGANARGQLGTGSTGGPSTSPVTVAGLTGASAITAGLDHTCVIVAGGQVKCWGWNGFGQLGDGGYVTRPEPVTVSGVTGATAISAGSQHTCAVVAGAQTRCWGHNFVGSPVGVPGGSGGGPISQPVPVAVTGLTGATTVTVRRGHSCAVTAPDDQARCWGYGVNGQLGNGTPAAGPVPVPVSGGAGVSALAAGGDHGCLVAGGSVRCWGVNHFGQVGDGTTTTRMTPVPVGGLSGVTSVAAGSDHSCAVGTGGTVACWGWGAHGQLGNGSLIGSTTPVAVPGVSGAVSVSAGWRHSCAVLGTGGVTCWGGNESGQLGATA